MAAESNKSTKPGDARFKSSIISTAKDRTVEVCSGGTGVKGVTNDALKKMGRGLAKVANQR